MTFKFYLGAACLLLITSPAADAAKADYCAAYAHDFADAQTQDKTLWQHKYDIALQSCLADPKPVVLAAPVPIKKIEKPKVAAAAKPEVVKPVAEKTVPAKPAVAPSQETDIPPEPAKLEQGSEAWNAYCANKYTSFNPTTGMYHSRTGVDRKCLVTNP